MNKIQIRRDTAANWSTVNPVLGSGEPALETDTRKRKTGDGVTAWASLAYDASGTSGTVAAATTTTQGIVQLAGDLAGTAALPTVPGLAGKLSSTDPSVTNARTPLAHKASHATGGADLLLPSDIGAATVTSVTANTTAIAAANGRALAYSIALGG